MTRKGSHKGRRAAIKKRLEQKDTVKFQKNAWVDTDVAKELAVDFVEREREKIGICG